MLICKSSEKQFQFHASRSPRWNLGNSSVICKDHKFECNPIVMQAKNKVAWDQAPQWGKTCGISSRLWAKPVLYFSLLTDKGCLLILFKQATWVEILCLNYKSWSCGGKISLNQLNQLKGVEKYLQHLQWKTNFQKLRKRNGSFSK